MNPHTQTPNNEVARLREVCEWAADMMDGISPARGQEIRDALARIAPIPEEKCSDDTANPEDMECENYKTSAHPNKCLGNVTEPANPTCANTTHKFSHCDCNEPSQKDTSTETCPSQKDTKVSVKEPHVHGCVNPKEIVNEWREIGPDEVICEGDEFQEKQYDPIKNKWYTIYECSMVGKKVSDSDWGRFRTRRPLPKQEEMPLDVIEQSLKWIEGDGKYALDLDEMFGEVVNCIRYLRDEIQKLKQK